MNLKSISLFALTTSLVIGLSGCATGSNSVRITYSKNTKTTSSTDEASESVNHGILVHINEVDRLVTIRNGRDLPTGFLITKNSDGKQTAIIKSRPPRKYGLRTADILEGQPAINNIISPVDAAESARLEQKYPTPINE